MYVPGCGCCDESCEADEEVLGVEGFVDGSGHFCGRGSGSKRRIKVGRYLMAVFAIRELDC